MLLYAAAFDANGGVFEPLFNEQDAIISDALNHASIIDGMRLCKGETTDKRIYNHRDTLQLKKMLEEDRGKEYRFRLIVSDGVFSMEGDLAPLPELVDLARTYDGILVVDDSHSVGVLGKTGRGTAEDLGVFGRVDITTGTLGKALGGAVGGFITGKKVIVDYLRQSSRPYIFSNSLPPAIVYTSLKAFELLEKDNSLVEKLHQNTAYFRKEIKNLGYTIIEGTHPIVPIMLGEAALAQDASAELLKEGAYIKGLWFPVVPRGEARLRAQISAALEKKDIDRALEAFKKVGKRLGILN